MDFSTISPELVSTPASRPDPSSTIWKISAGVGSGKTFGIAKTANGTYKGTPILYCAPTVALLKQTYDTMLDADGTNGFDLNPVLIYSTQTDARGKSLGAPSSRLANALVHSRGNTQILCTHITLIQLLSSLEFEREFLHRWTCFIDEEVKVVEQLYFSTKTAEEMKPFAKLVATEGEELVIAPRQKAVAIQAVKGQSENMALEAPRFTTILERMLAPVYTVYGKIEEHLLSAVAVLNPTKLYCFKEVVVVAAILEQTLTAHVWQTHFNIEMEPFELDHDLEYDPHAEGHRLTIRYLLPAGVDASISLISQGSVATDMAATVLGHWEGQGGVYTANKTLNDASGGRRDNPIHSLLEKQSNITCMPTVSHGLNDWEDATRIAVLSSTQPADGEISAVTEFADMDMKTVRGIYRLQTCYQAVGRTAIRDKHSSEQIDAIVLDERVANQLQNIFKGATVAGQLGDIEVYVGKGAEQKRPPGMTPNEGNALRRFVKRTHSNIRGGKALTNEKQARYDYGIQFYPQEG